MRRWRRTSGRSGRSRLRGVGGVSRTGLPLILALSLAGCFVTSEPFATPTPAEMSNLETAVRGDSTDVEAVARLAAGYVSGGQTEEARRVLANAHRRVPDDPTILVTLGIVEHELGLYDSAADRYEIYLLTHRGAFPDRVQARLDAIRNEDVRAEMQALLALDGTASESDGGARTPDPDRIAVIPFDVPDADGAVEPLGTALSWMVGRDLAAAGFQVVDRAAVRSLVEVMEVEPAQRSGLSLGVEVGRLLGAGQVILGEVRSDGSTGISWSATAISLEGNGQIRIAPVVAEAALDEVLQLESTMVELLRRSAAGELFLPGPGDPSPTPPPSVPDALLAFGRGLRAMDVGAFEEAENEFEEALALDPAFDRAAELGRRAGLARITAEIPLLATLEEAVRIGEFQRAVRTLRTSPGSTQQEALSRVGDRARAPVSEVLGLDRLGGSAVLELVFTPAPSGGP